jgi:sulfate transport system ATP-binding protein
VDALQTVEYLVSRDQDERQFNLDVGTRVLVYVPPDAIMGFNLDEIDSAPRL